MMSSTFSRRLRAAALAVALAMTVTACSNAVPSGAAAVVDGEVISLDLLDRIVDAQAAGAGFDTSTDEGAVQVEDLTRTILGALISFRVTESVADERGVEVTDAEIDEEFDAQIGLSGGADELAGQIEGLGLTEEEFRDIILANQVRQRKLSEAIADEVEVDEATVQATFEERRDAGQYDTAVVSHILVAFDVAEAGAAPTPDEDAAAETAARDILQRLDDGESFEELAIELSDDPGSGAQGGSLGEAPLNRYVPEFAEAAAEAPVGEVVGPVRTDFGYHLIRVDEREEVAFEDVADGIRQELSGAEASAAFEAALLAEVATIEVAIPSRIGVWNAETGEVEDGRDPVEDLSPLPVPASDVPSETVTP